MFLTGHTGFKGSWLTLLLARLGATVTGFSLPPSTEPSLFDLAAISGVAEGGFGDIRDLDALTRAMRDARPEVVFHLAAQALVRRSYLEPVATFDTNIMGTVHVLEAMRSVPSVSAAVIVTTDKCYDFGVATRPCREGDTLGGDDPYSASKAAAEVAVASYRRSYFEGRGGGRPIPIATGRAGNVIGGGDWSPDRIVTDLVAALDAGGALELRYPKATRPWQHVLDALAGYVMLGQRLLAGEARFAGAWNFGPSASETMTVQRFVELFAQEWGSGRAAWRQAPGEHAAENAHQPLDAGKASTLLGWQPGLSMEQAIRASARWHRAVGQGASARAVTEACIADYLAGRGLAGDVKLAAASAES